MEFSKFLSRYLSGFVYAFIGLSISHGISFVYNYLVKGEYKRVNEQMPMGQPYARIVVMHVAVIASAFISAAVGSPAGILVVLVILKMITDINLHSREHKKAGSR